MEVQLATGKSGKPAPARAKSIRKKRSTDDKSGRESPLFIRSTEKVFRVLELFGPGHPSLSVSQVAKLANLDLSAAQRCTHTLETLGLLKRIEGSKSFCLSPQTLFIGQRYLSSIPLMELATPYAVELNRRFEEMTSLSVLEHQDVVFISRLPGRQFLNAHITVGYRLPAFCTAPGLAILSKSPEATIEEALAGSSIRELTPNTETDTNKIRERIKRIREEGYVVTCEEYLLGDISVASPIIGESGYAVAAINVAVPTLRWDREEVESKMAPVVRQTAQSISHRFGFHDA